MGRKRKDEKQYNPYAREAVVRADIDTLVSPIFDTARGKKLALARMKLLMTQAELGEKLGVGQRTISRIEAGGHLFTCPAITLAALKTALEPEGWRFVMFYEGQFHSTAYDPGRIHELYWKPRRKKQGNRKTERSFVPMSRRQLLHRS